MNKKLVIHVEDKRIADDGIMKLIKNLDEKILEMHPEDIILIRDRNQSLEQTIRTHKRYARMGLLWCLYKHKYFEKVKELYSISFLKYKRDGDKLEFEMIEEEKFKEELERSKTNYNKIFNA